MMIPAITAAAICDINFLSIQIIFPQSPLMFSKSGCDGLKKYKEFPGLQEGGGASRKDVLF
jgi:hypothetical protein